MAQEVNVFVAKNKPLESIPLDPHDGKKELTLINVLYLLRVPCGSSVPTSSQNNLIDKNAKTKCLKNHPFL